jgi:hypothetical protein
MALFIIERNYAQELNPTLDDLKALGEVNAAVGVQWIYSFLSGDKRKTYCLYEAKGPDAIREAARRAGLPADVIIEVTQAMPPPENSGGA